MIRIKFQQSLDELKERLLVMAGLSLPPERPLLRHADDPTSVTPELPDTAVLCARCHTASTAKPKGFPQVVPADHSNGVPCQSCHDPHSPAMDASSQTASTKTAGGAK